MQATRLAAPRVLLATLVLTLAACATSPAPRFYTLDHPLPPVSADPVAGPRIIVGPVAVPERVDRPQLVVRQGEHQVRLLEQHRWAAPLPDEIARVLAAQLSSLLGSERVSAASFAGMGGADFRVALDFRLFESEPGVAVTQDVLWSVTRVGDGVMRSGRSLAREPVQGAGYAAVADAHGRALQAIARDIAAALRDLVALPAFAQPADSSPRR